MPIYDYSCSACGHSLETHQAMKDIPLTACPACGRPALRRLTGRGTGGALGGRNFYRSCRAPERGSEGGSVDLGQPPSAPRA